MRAAARVEMTVLVIIFYTPSSLLAFPRLINVAEVLINQCREIFIVLVCVCVCVLCADRGAVASGR